MTARDGGGAQPPDWPDRTGRSGRARGVLHDDNGDPAGTSTGSCAPSERSRGLDAGATNVWPTPASSSPVYHRRLMAKGVDKDRSTIPMGQHHPRQRNEPVIEARRARKSRARAQACVQMPRLRPRQLPFAFSKHSGTGPKPPQTAPNKCESTSSFSLALILEKRYCAGSIILTSSRRLTHRPTYCRKWLIAGDIAVGDRRQARSVRCAGHEEASRRGFNEGEGGQSNVEGGDGIASPAI